MLKVIFNFNVAYHISYINTCNVIYIYICNYLFFLKVILLRTYEDADCLCICNMYVVYVIYLSVCICDKCKRTRQCTCF